MILPNSLCPGSGANNKNFVIHFKEMSFKICKLTDIKSTMVQNFIKQTCCNYLTAPGDIVCNFCEQNCHSYISVVVSTSCFKFCDLNCTFGKLSVITNADFYPQEQKKRKNKSKEKKRKIRDESEEEEEEEVNGSN